MTNSKPRPIRSGFSYWWPITVRWKDMDAMGHVNNSTYFTYLESARIGFLTDLGWNSRIEGTTWRGPVVVSQTFNYRRQVHYPDELEVGVGCAEIRTRSLVIGYGVFRKGTDDLVGDGSTVLVWLDYAAGKAVDIPPDMRKALTGDAGK